MHHSTVLIPLPASASSVGSVSGRQTGVYRCSVGASMPCSAT